MPPHPIILGRLRVGLCLGLFCLANAEMDRSFHPKFLAAAKHAEESPNRGLRAVNVIEQSTASTNVTEEDKSADNTTVPVTVDSDGGFSLFGLEPWLTHTVIGGIAAFVTILVVFAICRCILRRKRKQKLLRVLSTTAVLKGRRMTKIPAMADAGGGAQAGGPEEKYDHKAAMMNKFINDSNKIAQTHMGKDLTGSDVINTINDTIGAYADQEDFESVSQRNLNATDVPKMTPVPGQAQPMQKIVRRSLTKGISKTPTPPSATQAAEPEPKSPEPDEGTTPNVQDINRPTTGRTNPLAFLGICNMCCKNSTYHDPGSWDDKGRGQNWSPMAEITKEQKSLAMAETFSKNWQIAADNHSAADDSSVADSDAESSEASSVREEEEEEEEEEGGKKWEVESNYAESCVDP
ncbi:hypothetical protein V1264_004588 [Littorina saxatilis]|uniref:Uncharacterized protein n=2 Tax=Littorina saxatilis TaxID=31220 RepID=A0AAN9B2X8_9CAEN